jgi:hypothetical protein
MAAKQTEAKSVENPEDLATKPNIATDGMLCVHLMSILVIDV